MNLIMFGTGEYQHWTALKYVSTLNERFATYVTDRWPDARVSRQEVGDQSTAAQIRKKLADWLQRCGPDDDLVLLWSGHGIGAGGHHRLITYDSAPLEGNLATENSILTQELADYLVTCPARRIVVLLNTCWSGDGSQQLAASIGDRAANSPAAKQTRSMAVISSARREEALDGAFVSSVLTVLRSAVPPTALAEEHRWPQSASALNPGQLCAAANVLLEDSDHQAMIQTPYGVVGEFFRRSNAALRASELPARVVARLQKDFPNRLPPHAGLWDAIWAKAAAEQLEAVSPAGELAYRLRRLALGLAALDLVESWLGPDVGLTHHLVPAWQSVLWPIHRIPHPEDRFGYVEQVVLHGKDQQVIEFIARVLRDAGDDPCDARLYEWSQRELGVDPKVVDDALDRIDNPAVQHRVIINFGQAIIDDDEPDALPESVTAWLHRLDGTCVASQEYSFEPPYDVSAMVARVVRWARAEAGDIVQVDVALPVALFRAAPRAEAARVQLHSRISEPVVDASGVVVRWADRIRDKELRTKGLVQGNNISMSSTLDWIELDHYATAQELFDKLKQPPQVAAFSFEPDDPDLFYAAALASPYVLWLDGSGDPTEIRNQLEQGWHDLPGRLREAYRNEKTSVICGARLVWDDPDWLRNIVPNLPDPDQRLSV